MSCDCQDLCPLIHLRMLVYPTLEFTRSRFSKILTWREKQRVVINRRVNQRDAACTASMYYQYLALSIFDSIAKISFLRRCLLLAAIWFQPTLNYSNDHTRHWSCKSMYIATFPFQSFDQVLKLYLRVNVCCWLKFDINPLLIIQTTMQGIDHVN